MSLQEYLAKSERLTNALNKWQMAQAAFRYGRGNSWGNTIRFSGRMAGNRLDREERARKNWSRIYDSVVKEWERAYGHNEQTKVETN